MSGWRAHCFAMKTMDSMQAPVGAERGQGTAQLDFDLALPKRKRVVRPCSRERAALWFDLMRRVVDEELEFPLPRRAR